MDLLNFLVTTSINCGNGVVFDKQIVNITSTIYMAIRWGVPIILIIVGMIDMAKAMTQQKEDEIKKAQNLLVKKAVAGLLVFLMFTIVKLVVGLVAGEQNNMWKCVGGLLGVEVTESSDSNTTGNCTSKLEGNTYVLDSNNCKTNHKPTVNGTSCSCVSNG